MKDNFFLTEIIAPLARRIGTASAAFFGGIMTMQPHQTEVVALAVGSVVVVAAELAFSHFARKGK